MAGRPWPGWAPPDAEVWLRKRPPRPDARGGGREGDDESGDDGNPWDNRDGRVGRSGADFRRRGRLMVGRRPRVRLARPPEAMLPPAPSGRRRGETPNGHGGRTSIDNVVVQRVRRRAATTTTKGKGNEFRRRFNPKKAGGPRRPAASRGSHCPATANVVSSFFPRQLRSQLSYRGPSIRPPGGGRTTPCRKVSCGKFGFLTCEGGRPMVGAKKTAAGIRAADGTLCRRKVGRGYFHS